MNLLTDKSTPLHLLSVAEARAVIIGALNGGSGDLQVIVDFDETLWLLNSTEEYLASLRPRWLAWLILLAIDAVRPWTFMKVSNARLVYRDWMRTLVCTILMPWSLISWRICAKTRAERWQNRTLLDWLKKDYQMPLHVATLGLKVLVAPILKHIDPNAKLIAGGSLWSGYQIRTRGKSGWIEDRHAGLVAGAIVVTDSEHDADILAAAHTPVFVKWPEAAYRPAFSETYIPFLYTQKAKRPGENYMLYGFLLEDVVHLWLAFLWLTARPAIGALAILLLHLSFWAIYELGYVENDVLAVNHEVKPKIYPEAATYAGRVKTNKAWLVALLLSIPGLALLQVYTPDLLVQPRVGLDSRESFGILLATWIAYLFVQRIVFWIYNRLDPSLRGLFYVVLQMIRLSGYALLLRLNIVSAVLLLSLVIARWIKYLAYRETGRTLAESQRLLSVVFFVVLACGTVAIEPAAFLSLQAAASFLWLAAYSHRRLRELLRSVKIYRY